MRLVILGPPGSGKGTQCARLASFFELPHIGSGETLRRLALRDDELGRSLKMQLEQGALVDDALVVAAILERVRSEEARRGFLLDGFPRNRKQALALGVGLAEDRLWLDHAVLLEVDDEVALDRVSGRVVDASGRVFHERFSPPPAGLEVARRTGDNREAHLHALQEYRRISQPMVEIYEDRDLLLRVDGNGSIDEVSARLSEAIGSIG